MSLLNVLIGIVIGAVFLSSALPMASSAMHHVRYVRFERTLENLVSAAEEYHSMNCPLIQYNASGSPQPPCSTASWPSSWTPVSRSRLGSSQVVAANGTIASPLDGNPISIGGVTGDMGVIAVPVSNPADGAALSNRIPFASYQGGVLSVYVGRPKNNAWERLNAGQLPPQ